MLDFLFDALIPTTREGWKVLGVFVLFVGGFFGGLFLLVWAMVLK